MADARLQLLLDLQDNVSAGLAAASGSVNDFGKSINDLKPAFDNMAKYGAIGFAAVSGEIALSVKAFADSQAQLQVVDSILGTLSTKTLVGLGGSLDTAKTKVREFGAQMQAMGGIGDEAASEGLAKLLQITGDYTQASKDATLAADLSIFKNIDYATAVDVVGKVAAGNTSILTRYGIVLDANATSTEALAALTKLAGGQYAASGQTIAGQTKILTQTLGDLQENIGQALVPALTGLFNAVKPVLDSFVKWTAEHPKLVAAILGITAGMFGLVAIVGTLGLGLIALTGAATALGISFAALLGWIALIPIAIAALVVAGIYLYKHWDDIKAKAAEVWAYIVGVWNSIRDGVSAAMQSTADFLESIWSTIENIFFVSIDFIIGVVKTLLDFFFPGWEAALTSIYSATTTTLGAVGAFISGIMASIKSTISSALGTIQSVWDTAWNAIGSTFSSIWATIQGVAKAAFDFISDGINKLLGPLQNIIDLATRAYNAASKVVSSVGNAAASGISSLVSTGASITGRASGGPVLGGTPYLVGENGPEYFIPGGSGTIAPRLGLAGGGISLVITGNTFLSEEDFADKIGGILMKQLKNNVRI